MSGKRRPPTGTVSPLRRMAYEDPAHASALIVAALTLTDGHRAKAARGLADAGLLTERSGAYRALRRCLAALPGLGEMVEARWPGVPACELGGPVELAAKLKTEATRLRAVGRGGLATALDLHVATLATGDGVRMARQAVRRIEMREKSTAGD